ncbi:tRNA (guanosine(46)-N7)-methyltransferase TrmB [Peptococcus simiae]|uniref:tRNA (guanosine(46)-N7)-methyltransferase TrmB n=1 Tax=Peptococcus simiae TaxID=1643805 RepID=UPI00397FF909
MARVRHIPGTHDMLLENPYVITQAEASPAFWAKCYPKSQALRIEVGSGRGRFIYTAGKTCPDKNWLALDVVPEIIREAVESYSRRADWPENIRFMACDASELLRILPARSVERIYLHFSDPWPKKRHAKRRLTAPGFLAIYAALLQEDGDLLFKTDHDDFYTYSLESFRESGWQIVSADRDIYRDLPADNIATEYERRYHRRQVPIGQIIATPPRH